jgi:hypothetical protein
MRLRARLLVRALEARVEPTVFVVTNSLDGPVTAAGQLPGSLRQAIFDANANGQADTITFDLSVTTINLTTGQLTISENKNLLIDGGGKVTINGAATASATNRLFNITAGGTPTITINSLTLAKGNVTAYIGGAINVGAQTLLMTNDSLLNNSAYSNFGDLGGGAIYGSNSTITLNSCRLDGNAVTGYGYGGGVNVYDCHLSLTDCSTINNTAIKGYGGGLEISDSFATLMNCTIAGNSAGGSGGLDLYSSSTTTLTNCTIANNFGGAMGIYGPTNIRNCTISSNTVTGSYGSGGITSIGATPQIDSSIVARNLPHDFPASASIQGSHNLIGDATGVTIVGTNDPALIGYGSKLVDPGLVPLGDYGGPTQTMALRYTSVAIDKGSNPAGLAFDQRGQPRESPLGLPDIGAVEGFAAVPFVASVGPLPTVYKAGGTSYSVTVAYDAPNSIDTSSLDSADITVSGPNPVGPVIFSGFTTSGNQVTATYKSAPPGGSWDKFDIGAYSINLAGGQVKDLSQPAKYIPAQSLGTVHVSIAGVFIVDTVGDQADGDYGPGKFTLREAMQWASTDPNTNDTIAFDPSVFGTPKTIVLGSQLVGSGPIVINGPGAALLTISGNNANRILSGDSITLNGLTLSNGKAAGNGGAVMASRLIATNCIFSNNVASGLGGAISTNYGLTLSKSALSGNQAASGGAISSYDSFGPSQSSISDCNITGNHASAVGGGIYLGKYYANISGSTISGNSAANGGGLCVKNIGTVLDNCTISGNTATSAGGGVFLKNYTTALSFHNCTIATNSAAITGGGLYRDTNTAIATLNNTIVASNLSPSAPDLSFNSATNITGDNNFIGVADSGNVTFTGNNNQTGTLAAPLNAMLAPLANYGGLTQTMALLPSSPCIDAGSPIAGINTDQRGYLRTYGSAPDIGAYELQPPRVASVVINDGSAQRSRVTGLTVNFDSLVTLPALPAGAFQLQRQSDGKLVDLTANVVNTTTTSVTFTFNGALSEFGSLQDGRYTLTAFGAQVSNFVGSLDGNGDSVPGDDYVLASNGSTGVFRLFGDVNGDGTVSANDLIAFRQYFGGFLFAFDFDGDGSVSANDFLQFRLRFGGSI